MKKITPITIDFYSKGQNGQELKTKRGDNYIKARIKTDTETIYLNVFNPSQKELLKVGQAIELETEQNGKYLNYSFPKQKSETDKRIDILIQRINKLEKVVYTEVDAYRQEEDRLNDPNFENNQENNKEEDIEVLPF